VLGESSDPIKQVRSTYQAAVGWYDLALYSEAFNELDNLPPEHRASIDVMELRCRIYRKLEKWPELEIVAWGCLESCANNEQFAADLACALLKQGKVDMAVGALGRNLTANPTNPEFC
jgi:predicted Zn-dependent protease